MKRYTMLSAAGIDKAREVMEVTMGRAKADLVITNGTLLNVYTGNRRALSWTECGDQRRVDSLCWS